MTQQVVEVLESYRANTSIWLVSEQQTAGSFRLPRSHQLGHHTSGSCLPIPGSCALSSPRGRGMQHISCSCACTRILPGSCTINHTSLSSVPVHQSLAAHGHPTYLLSQVSMQSPVMSPDKPEIVEVNVSGMRRVLENGAPAQWQREWVLGPRCSRALAVLYAGTVHYLESLMTNVTFIFVKASLYHGRHMQWQNSPHA
jgi:hypothetical protein